jgi:hypothetical protein
MLNKSTSEQDFPASITPEIRSRMPWRVAEVTPRHDFRLAVLFVDGTRGTVDLSELIRSPRAGIFAPLADPALFAQVFVEHGVVTWPGELDLAPDAMYTEIKQHGEWRLK